MRGIIESWKEGRVIRLNTDSDVTRQYAERVGVRETPTFLLFDSRGQELRRWVGQVPALTDLR